MNTSLQINPQLYEWFGVSEYTDMLRRENKHEELEKLHDTLSQFILLQATEDLPEGARKQLEDTQIQDGAELFAFFHTHIDHFQDKIKDYGRMFRNAYITN